MMILEKAEKHGDCFHAVELAKLLSPRRENLRAWFARFSPISVDISRKQHKAHFFKSANVERKSFDLPAARRTPFHKLASRRDFLTLKPREAYLSFEIQEVL